MEVPYINNLFLVFSFLSATFLLYYSSALQRLNSAQIEKLFDIQDDEYFRGIRVTLVVLSVRLGALCIELLFLFLLMIKIISSTGWNWRTGLVFFSIGLGFQTLSRIYLPYSLPLRERESLSTLEVSIFLLCAYVFFVPSYILEKTAFRLLVMLYPKTDDERIAEAEETIKSIINTGEKEGIFKEEEGELLQSIVDFSETIAREVMTPRIDLQCIEITSSIEHFLKLVIETGYSKIPAFRERIDNIEGILYAKDLLKFWRNDDQSVPLVQIARPAYFVPETKKVRSLLREFQQEKVHMAIVVDEYGGVAGVVTIEDLLEEIVGEIHDEYDTEQEMLHLLGENTWIVDARMDLDELSDMIDVEFPEESYETLGGFLFDLIGRIPAPGETHRYKNLRFEIKEADARRIRKAIIYRELVSDEETKESKGNEQN